MDSVTYTKYNLNMIDFHPIFIVDYSSFSLYLRHGFCFESEDVEANRVNRSLKGCFHYRVLYLYFVKNPTVATVSYCHK